MFYKKIMPARIPLRVYHGYILNINGLINLSFSEF